MDKTLKISERVHKDLKRLKAKYDAETFDEALRYEMGLIAAPDGHQLGAYFPLEEHREQAQALIDLIDSLGAFEKTVKRSEITTSGEEVHFKSKETGRVIGAITFPESSDWCRVYFRGQLGDLTATAVVRYYRDEDRLGYGTNASIGTSEDLDFTDVQDIVTEKIEGADRRWGRPVVKNYEVVLWAVKAQDTPDRKVIAHQLYDSMTSDELLDTAPTSIESVRSKAPRLNAAECREQLLGMNSPPARQVGGSQADIEEIPKNYDVALAYAAGDRIGEAKRVMKYLCQKGIAKEPLDTGVFEPLDRSEDEIDAVMESHESIGDE